MSVNKKKKKRKETFIISLIGKAVIEYYFIRGNSNFSTVIIDIKRLLRKKYWFLKVYK